MAWGSLWGGDSWGRERNFYPPDKKQEQARCMQKAHCLVSTAQASPAGLESEWEPRPWCGCSLQLTDGQWPWTLRPEPQVPLIGSLMRGMKYGRRRLRF